MAKLQLLALLGILCLVALGQARSFPSALNARSAADADKSDVPDAQPDAADADDAGSTNGNDVAPEAQPDAAAADDVDSMNDDDVDKLVEGVVDDLTKDENKKPEDVDDVTKFPVDKMGGEEIDQLIQLEDRLFGDVVGLHVTKQVLLENESAAKPNEHSRRKRVWGVVARGAFTIGRRLFTNFGRSAVTKSGTRITQHYAPRVNNLSALKDFQKMRPSNVKSFSNGRISGQTGSVGNYRVTVRDGSTKGVSRPTLSVHREGNKNFLRKFRYDKY